jgi:hypothetical protein
MMALGLVRVAARIERATPEKREEIAGLDRTVVLTEEAKRLCADPLVEPSLRDLLEAKYLDRSHESVRGPKIGAAIDALREKMLDDPRALAGALEYLRREYRNVAAEQEGLLQEVTLRITRRLEFLNNVTRGSQDGRSPFVMPGGTADPAPVATAEPANARRRGVLRIFRGRR